MIDRIKTAARDYANDTAQRPDSFTAFEAGARWLLAQCLNMSEEVDFYDGGPLKPAIDLKRLTDFCRGV